MKHRQRRFLINALLNLKVVIEVVGRNKQRAVPAVVLLRFRPNGPTVLIAWPGGIEVALTCRAGPQARLFRVQLVGPGDPTYEKYGEIETAQLQNPEGQVHKQETYFQAQRAGP